MYDIAMYVHMCMHTCFKCIYYSIAETISNISESSPEKDSKLVAEVSVSDVNNRDNPANEQKGRVQDTPQKNKEPLKNQTNITAGPLNTSQSPSSSKQATTPVALHTPIKISLRERCIQAMGEQMWNKNYTLQYMNYAATKNNHTYFTTIYKYDPDAEDYSVQCSLSYDDTQKLFNKAGIKNQEVYLVVPYVLGDKELYCVGLKRRKSGELKLFHLFGLKPAEADQLHTVYKKHNYQLVGERYVAIGDEVKATSVYQYSQSTQQTVRHRDLTYNTLMNRIVKGQREGYHITDISSYVVKGVARYSLLLTTNFSKLRYKWSLRSRQRTKGLLKTFTREGLYPLAIVSTNLGYSQPYYLVSLMSAA